MERPIQIRQPAIGLIESADTNWELAQFDLKLSGDGDGMKRLRRIWLAFWKGLAWRPARWGLIGLLLANVIGLNTWAWQQKTVWKLKNFPHQSTYPNFPTSQSCRRSHAANE